MESRSQQLLQRAPPYSNAFGSPHTTDWAAHSWTCHLLDQSDAFKHRLLPLFLWGKIEEKGNMPCENFNILLSCFCPDWLLFTQG